MNTPHLIIHELTEYQPKLFSAEAIPPDLGELLWQTYDNNQKVVAVEFPTPITGNQWRLTSQGWVGYLPVSSELGIRLQPKVKLENLFGMLEVAYHLKSFRFLEGWHHCDVLDDFYERLATVLARRTLDRARKGFYRTYIPKIEQTSFVRGRMDIRYQVQRPWDVSIKCHYKEHTADIEDNQILLWTLHQIARIGIGREEVRAYVRKVYHALQGTVSLEPYTAQACINRPYNRLNADYQPLHALCRFFPEQSGPSHEMGDRKMLPFLVNMARLYELFVTEWLKANIASSLLPHYLTVKAQETVHLDPNHSLSFNIDLVLNNDTTGETRYVLDTKYKTPDFPSPSDVAQIIAYAKVRRCSEAVLIYPEPLRNPLNVWADDIHVRTLTFAIDADLDQGGQAFLSSLLI
ncbi:McrC family protein [Leptolyngbya ohadii]|uniref:McrC family protein n=1 Tax=Leptolyngbya ohadii TaxID=1962290 RepID=UPI000B5A10DA|nr:restriction endonuclease [Leptolyngbya ohadii]